MSDTQLQFPVRRIIIALESVCENLKTLEAAADVAERIKAELHGIFIEDVDLLSAAHLPFVRQVNLHSPVTRSFEPADVEAEFRVLAARAKASLEQIALRMKVPWSFEVLRGKRVSLASATQPSDMLVVETESRPFARYMKLPTDWSDVSLSCEGSCLLLSASAVRCKCVLAVHDGAEGGERAIAAGIALAGAGSGLTIVAPSALQTGADVRRRMRVAGVEAELQTIDYLNSAELSRVIARTNGDLVILPASLALAHRSALQELLVTPPCAVLLVR